MAEGFRQETILLDAASDKRPVHVSGSYIQSIEMSSSSALLQIAVNEPTNESFDFKRGFGWINGAYHRLFVTNTAQPGEWVKLMLGGSPTDVEPNTFRAFPVSPEDNVVITGQSSALDVNSTIVAQNADPFLTQEGGKLLSDAEVLNTAQSMSFSTTLSSFPVVYTVPASKKLWIRRARLRTSTVSSSAETKIVIGAQPIVRASSLVNFGGGVEVFENYILPAATDIQLAAAPAAGTAYLDMWSELHDA